MPESIADPQTQREAQAYRRMLQEASGALYGLSQASIEATAAEEAELELSTKGRKLTEQEIELHKQWIKASKEVKATQEALNKIDEQILASKGESAEVQAALAQKFANVQNMLHTLKIKEQKLSIMAGAGFQKLMKGINLFSAALTFIVGILMGEYRREKEALEKLTGMIDSDLGPSFTEARLKMEMLTYTTGLAAGQMLESIKANRQLVNTLGGATTAIDAYSGHTRDQFFAMTGDLDKGFRLMLESMTVLRRSGIKPTNDQLISYAQDIQKAAWMTNMSTAEIQSMFQEVAADTDSLVLLRAAREDEREAILASQRALINMNIAAGMTADQAKEAAKMLNKMVAAKPLDRMKQAARMRALGGALGIAGSEEAAKAVMAGPRATAEQKKNLMEFSKSAASVADQMRGAGLGAEIFSTTLLDKLDLDQYYGAGSNFSATLIKALENNAPPPANAITDPLVQHLKHADHLVNIAGALASGQGVLGSILWAIQNPIKSFFGGTKETPEQEAARREAAKVQEEILNNTGMGFIQGVEAQEKSIAVASESRDGISTTASNTAKLVEVQDKQTGLFSKLIAILTSNKESTDELVKVTKEKQKGSLTNQQMADLYAHSP